MFRQKQIHEVLETSELGQDDTPEHGGVSFLENLLEGFLALGRGIFLPKSLLRAVW